MNTLTLKNIIKVAATSICISAISGQAANAGQMHGGWNYAIDSSASVPEPASVMGLAAVGLIGASGKLRKRK